MQTIRDFFLRYPIFYFSLAVLLGTGLGLSPMWGLYLITICICYLSPNLKLCFFWLLLLVSISVTTSMRYPKLDIEKPIYGDAQVKFSEMKKLATPLGHLYLLSGTILDFSHYTEFEGRPFKLKIRRKPHIDLNYSYHFPCRVQKAYHYQLILGVDKKTVFEKKQKLQWLPKLRHQWKEYIKTWIRKRHRSNETQALLIALATGEVSDAFLSFHFQKLGLQHLLAISGFHFGIVIVFFSIFLSLGFPKAITQYLLCAIALFYFLYLGNAPSIQRAWLGASFVLIGNALHIRAKTLNILGLSAICDLLFVPLDIFNFGFSLSYLATFGIFTLYAPTFDMLSSYWNIPHISIVMKKAIVGFKKTLAVTIAASIPTLPVILFAFHTFSILGLLYNLFLPVFITVTMGLFMLSLLLFFVPPLSSMLCILNSYFSYSYLQLLFYYPRKLAFSLSIRTIPPSFCFLFVASIVYFSIFLLEKREKLITL